MQISVNGKTTISFLNMHVCVRMNVCVEVGGGGVLKKRRGVRTVPCLVFSYKNMRLTIWSFIFSKYYVGILKRGMGG